MYIGNKNFLYSFLFLNKNKTFEEKVVTVRYIYREETKEEDVYEKEEATEEEETEMECDGVSFLYFFFLLSLFLFLLFFHLPAHSVA